MKKTPKKTRLNDGQWTWVGDRVFSTSTFSLPGKVLSLRRFGTEIRLDIRWSNGNEGTYGKDEITKR